MNTRSMSDKDFATLYGVTPQQVEDALQENRRRVRRKLHEWGYAWAVDEIMCDVTVELLKGGLRRWHAYPDRKPLGAFVNTLLGNRLGEWMRTERPKYKSGMTHTPRTRRSRQDRQAPPREALDADTARDRLRREERAASGDRLCEETDIFGETDSAILSAPSGDRFSYQQWLTGSDVQTVESSAYADDMKWMKGQTIRLGGTKAWKTLLAQCFITSTRGDGDRLRREIRLVLEKHHAGSIPELTDYPYIRRVLDWHREAMP